MTLPLFKAAAADLHVFATASLTDALKEIAAGFEKESGLHATLNFCGLEPAGAANRERRVN